jgi:uncharacterized protein (DUF1697 family)
MRAPRGHDCAASGNVALSILPDGQRDRRLQVPRKITPVMHVALLRGINVGKTKRVAMTELRALFESMGYGHVQTLLNSGNIVFSAPRADPKAAARIEKEIASRLGIEPRVVVITSSELDSIVAENPLPECDESPSSFLVTVLASDADRERLERLTAQSWGAERLSLGSRAAYLWCANGINESKAALALAKAAGSAGTSRNWATIKKLQALTSSGPAPRP